MRKVKKLIENNKRLAKGLSHQVTQCSSYGSTLIPSVECLCPAVTESDRIFSEYSIKIIAEIMTEFGGTSHTMFCEAANKRSLGYDCQ
jgi:hypothetical protein